MQLLARPQLAPPLPLLQIHSPLPPPLLTGAPLFIPALRNMDRPWLLPDVAEGALVAFVTADDSSSKDMVQYVGVGRMAARGGVRGAWERRMKHLKEGADVDEGKFCDVVCIKGDQWARPRCVCGRGVDRIACGRSALNQTCRSSSFQNLSSLWPNHQNQQPH